MTPFDTPARIERLRARALCVIIAVAAVAIAAVFFVPTLLPAIG